MPYKSAQIERIHLVRWGEAPQTQSEMDAVLGECQQIYRSIGPIIGISLVSQNLPLPTGEVREHLNRRMNDLLALCESVHFVIEGSGFKNSILRSVVTNILMLTGKRGRIFVHKSLEEALDSLAPRLKDLGILPSRVVLAAQSKGLLTPVRLKESRPGLMG